jgi:SAM-dependent methyltransferase
MISLEEAYHRVYGMYPGAASSAAASPDLRMKFNVQLVLDHAGANGNTRKLRVCDVGGGTSSFTPMLAAMGHEAVLVDDFRDLAHYAEGKADLEAVHKPLGVEIVSRDVVSQGLDFPDQSFDVIACFESMEHWHASPRRVFKDVMRCLKAGGWFVLSVPNAVDLKKRWDTFWGVADWSSIPEWYESDVFRGHVREPTTRDLVHIGRDMGLSDVHIFGRTWILRTRGPVWRAIAKIVDLRPGFSSSLYMVGRKS